MDRSQIWHLSYGKRLSKYSPFLGMAFQVMEEMMLRNKKNREGWVNGSIANNIMSLPFYRITVAEGMVHILME
jgi:hypothetical protein